MDPNIEPVSRSSPSAGAQQAMDVCNIGILGLDAIAGMGLIEAATDSRDYAPLTGREPELLSTEPAWMIQLQGEVPQLRGAEIWMDPVCVVIGDSGGFYASGPVVLSSGELYTPAPVPVPPTYSLPPLDP